MDQGIHKCSFAKKEVLIRVLELQEPALGHLRTSTSVGLDCAADHNSQIRNAAWPWQHRALVWWLFHAITTTYAGHLHSDLRAL